MGGAIMQWIMRRRRAALGFGAFGMFGLLLGFEAVIEGQPTALDVVFEAVALALLIGTTVASALLVVRMHEQEERSGDLRRAVVAIRADNAAWRQETAAQVRELGRAIQRQLADWGLTAAEQEIGLLLLKGFSHKKISRIRQTTETTVRQQAAAVYQKSGLGGRAELAAFFLDELMPSPQIDAPPTAPAGTLPFRATPR